MRRESGATPAGGTLGLGRPPGIADDIIQAAALVHAGPGEPPAGPAPAVLVAYHRADEGVDHGGVELITLTSAQLLNCFLH